MPEDSLVLPESTSNPETAQSRGRSRGFYELEAIRKRPAMWLGRKSLQDFYSFIGGYSYARTEDGVAPSAEEIEFTEFDAFVQRKYHGYDVGGWAAKIAYYHRDDAMALDEFFKLLDEFRNGKRQQRERKGRKRRKN